MKTGITIWAFENGVSGNVNVNDVIRKTKETGFDALELSFYDKGQVSFDYDKSEIDRIKKTSKEFEIILSSLSTLLLNDSSLVANDLSEAEYAFKTVKTMIELASLLEIPTVSISPGRVTEDLNYKVAYDRAVTIVRQLGEIAEKLGIKLCVENVWQGFLLSPLEFRRFIDDVSNSWVGACFDIGNTLLLGYPHHWVDVLDDKIYKVHFDDVRRRKGQIFEFVNLGDGEVNWEAVMQSLNAVGYSNFATVEAFYAPKKDEGQRIKEINERLKQIIQ